MPKGFSEREKDLIRQRLVRAGHEQFSARGLKKTSVDDLAAAANISKGAFYLFYESKEALFLDVIEWAERRYHQDILADVERPGPTPRARLLALFQRAFGLLRTEALLRPLMGSEYEVLFRRVPPERLDAHLAMDRVFFENLVARCRASGIPIQVRSDAIGRLLYPLVLAVMHEDDFGAGQIAGGVDGLLALVAAYCLGELAPEAGQEAAHGSEH